MAVPLQSQAVQKCCSGSCLRSYSSCFSAHTLVRSNDSGRTMEHIVFFSYSSQTRFHFGFPSPRCFSHWTIFYVYVFTFYILHSVSEPTTSFCDCFCPCFTSCTTNPWYPSFGGASSGSYKVALFKEAMISW